MSIVILVLFPFVVPLAPLSAAVPGPLPAPKAVPNGGQKTPVQTGSPGELGQPGRRVRTAPSPVDLGRIERINPAGTSYLDPEIHPLRDEMVFQAPDGVWTGALDPRTGRFVSATGKDRFVDIASSLTLSKNGPEYGIDRDGTSIFYNRTGFGGVERVWRAVEQGAGYVPGPLTGFDTSRINQLPSQDEGATSTFLVYGRDALGAAPPTITWIDEDDPGMENEITPVVPGYAGFRWARGTTWMTSTIASGPQAGEVVLTEARTGFQKVVTDDGGIKFDPYPWQAPEFGGSLAFAAIVAGGDLAIYRDVGNLTFVRHATLSPPPVSSMEYAQSPEPFVSAGRSFVCLTLKDHPGSIYTDVTEAQIWIYGIEEGPGRFVLRCDDAATPGIRHEAEAMAGTDEIFLYYNELLPNGRFDLLRCRTGLPR